MLTCILYATFNKPTFAVAVLTCAPRQRAPSGDGRFKPNFCPYEDVYAGRRRRKKEEEKKKKSKEEEEEESKMEEPARCKQIETKCVGTDIEKCTINPVK